MKEAEENLLMLKGAISDLQPEDQKAIKDLAENFRKQLAAAGEPIGTLAFALVGAELQASAK